MARTPSDPSAPSAPTTPQASEHTDATATAPAGPAATSTTPAKRRKSFNRATAEQADGALAAPRTAYEIAGIQDVKYGEKTYAAYEAKLRKLELVELHDVCFDVAVVGSANREVTITRLLDKFLSDNPGERAVLARARTAAASQPETITQQAERIMERGR